MTILANARFGRSASVRREDEPERPPPLVAEFFGPISRPA